jgi:anthranilate synthase component II
LPLRFNSKGITVINKRKATAIMKILVYDNYDSFTYNLVHLVEKIIHTKVDVYRNDQIPLEKVSGYDKIILSPGPGIPEEAGLLLPLIRQYAASKPILGVCLGHQAIGEAFGGRLVNLSTVYHGVATDIEIKGGEAGEKTPLADTGGEWRQRPAAESYLFSGLPSRFPVGRYHSWIISEEAFPGELEITARDGNGQIMALQHKEYDVQGVQFHPESVLTPDGETIIRNWLNH